MKEFFKNKSLKIVIKNRSYKGREFVDIRQYFKDKESGEFKHSTKGITIPLNQFQEFKKIFNTHSENDKDINLESTNNNEEEVSDRILKIAKKLVNE